MIIITLETELTHSHPDHNTSFDAFKYQHSSYRIFFPTAFILEVNILARKKKVSIYTTPHSTEFILPKRSPNEEYIKHHRSTFATGSEIYGVNIEKHANSFPMDQY